MAHGGQVVVSDVVRGLLAGAPLGPVTLLDLGLHRLRDLPSAENVWQVVPPGLAREFPELAERGEDFSPTELQEYLLELAYKLD